VVALRQLSFLYVIIATRAVDAISETIFTSFATSLLSGSLIRSILYVAKLLHVLIFFKFAKFALRYTVFVHLVRLPLFQTDFII